MVSSITPYRLYIPSIDYEHLRIIAELRKLGITPTGIKSVDAALLEKAMAELFAKMKKKNQEGRFGGEHSQFEELLKEMQNNERAELEEERLGATTLAEQKKFYFKL